MKEDGSTLMHYMSHKWKIVPETRLERRQVLNVREPIPTCIAWNMRYQDIDTGKFDRDKMPSIKCTPWEDLINVDEGNGWIGDWGRAGTDYYAGLEDRYNECKFPDRAANIKKQRKLEEEHEERREASQREDRNKEIVEQAKLAREEYWTKLNASAGARPSNLPTYRLADYERLTKIRIQEETRKRELEENAIREARLLIENTRYWNRIQKLAEEDLRRQQEDERQREIMRRDILLRQAAIKEARDKRMGNIRPNNIGKWGHE